MQKICTAGLLQKLEYGIYSELLDLCSVSSLENHCLYLKLCHMFNVVNNVCNFAPENVVQLKF